MENTRRSIAASQKKFGIALSKETKVRNFSTDVMELWGDWVEMTLKTEIQSTYFILIIAIWRHVRTTETEECLNLQSKWGKIS